MLDLGTWRIFAKEVVAFPICRRSDWPRNETTTAVRADIAQNGVDTRRAKRALIGTNARFKRLGWQCFVAILACGSEFKHVAFVTANAFGFSETAPAILRPPIWGEGIKGDILIFSTGCRS